MVGEFEVFHRETDIAFPRAIGVEDAKALFRRSALLLITS